MNNLYSRLKKYNIQDAIKFEENDRQFIALKNLEKNIEDKELYLLIIVINSLICYQLSWKWEDYWEEFSLYFSQNIINQNIILDEMIKFLKQSQNNKRFINNKIKRINKMEEFINLFRWKTEYYYKNMRILRDVIAQIMNQHIDAKTVVFAVKMFGYWARNIFNFVEYPFEIFIPIDSRLTKIFEKYNQNPDIDKIEFYQKISQDLEIPPLHLDWIIRNSYSQIIKE